MSYNHDEVYRVGLMPVDNNQTTSSSSHRRGPSIDNKAFALPSRPDSEDDDGSTTSSMSSYAGSAESYTKEEFSPVEYLTDTLMSAMDPSQLDRVIVIQAQTSGMVNAKSKEILQLQEEATRRLEQLKLSFAKGVKVAKQVEKDLEWAHRHTQALIKKTRLNHPIEFAQAEEKVRGN